MSALAFHQSACGNSQESNSENRVTMDTLQSEQDSALETAATESGINRNVTSPTISAAAFSGKVSGCYYADGSRVIVASDKLYLYDTVNGKTIASADISMDDLCVQTYAGGYFIVGQGNGGGSNGSSMVSQDSNGINGYILNQDFKLQNTISFNGLLLTNDILFQITGAAISQDGKQVAFSGLEGLYLYDVPSKKVRTLLNYSENGRADNMELAGMDSLAFSGNNTLVYVGAAIDTVKGGDSFSVYGTVSTDSAKLTITKKAGYLIDGGEVQKGGNLLIMPQSFNKNNGTLLMLDTASNTEKTMSFSSRSEGKDGVFCSSQGKYVATSVLGKSSVTVNIYDAASGKILHTETVSDSNSTYFLRTPQILILEESNTCIVVLGRGIGEVNTLITAFGFKG